MAAVRASSERFAGKKIIPRKINQATTTKERMYVYLVEKILQNLPIQRIRNLYPESFLEEYIGINKIRKVSNL